MFLHAKFYKKRSYFTVFSSLRIELSTCEHVKQNPLSDYHVVSASTILERLVRVEWRPLSYMEGKLKKQNGGYLLVGSSINRELVLLFEFVPNTLYTPILVDIRLLTVAYMV